VAADGVQREAEPLAGFLVLGMVVVMPGAFRVRSVGLEGVSSPVDEEVEVIRDHAGRRFETMLPHFLLPEIRWMVPLLNVGGETMRFLCYMDRVCACLVGRTARSAMYAPPAAQPDNRPRFWARSGAIVLRMSIDDKLAQAKARVESDERQRSISGEIAVELLRLCNSIPFLKDCIAPISGPLQAILETVHKRRLDNVCYLVDVIIERVQELGVEVQSHSDKHKAFIENDWVNLVLDGVAKAQQARARERIKRLGEILAYAYAEGEKRSPDLTEEMLRIAAGLDEDDVKVLAWLCEGMKSKFSRKTGQVDFESANDFWGRVEHHEGKPSTPEGLNVGDAMACCAKLQAFGLVLQVRQNPGKMFTLLPYGPLTRGYEFIEYLRSVSGTRRFGSG
jgi:hypothetical protein